MKWISAFFLICISLCGTLSNEVRAGDKALLAEADSLYADGNWFAAAIAYERVFYSSPDSDHRLLANLGKARSLKQEGRYSEAFSAMERSLTEQNKDSLRFELFYELALCAFLMENTPETASLLVQMEYYFPDKQEDSRMYLLHSLVLMREESWPELQAFLMKWMDSLALEEEEQEILSQELHRVLDEANIPARREVHMARMWSTFIPGSGQMYAGYTGKGLLNAFSQAASLGTAVILGMNAFYIAGTIVGLGAFQSFYFGGIEQAGELAGKRNMREKAAREADLTRLILHLAGYATT